MVGSATLSLRSWGDCDDGSSWKEVAKAFSAYVHATYTVHDIPVDARPMAKLQ